VSSGVRATTATTPSVENTTIGIEHRFVYYTTALGYTKEQGSAADGDQLKLPRAANSTPLELDIDIINSNDVTKYSKGLHFDSIWHLTEILLWIFYQQLWAHHA
jgi:hypothetical protein